MKTYHQPSGLNQGIDLLIDAHWTPEQALAVVELLDDLRDRIWSHYQSLLFELLRQNIQTKSDGTVTRDMNDPPF
jgi:hypothetical protein